ncbi:MAG TPA: glycyl-radical enzyme activating protein [Lentisphaeria bacterium]|nr:glycyl-radical enzyme activating protein [Lentisphaeria bacterium]
MTARAPVADFKRFAVHDGPGIRTTVFLKGCSLACQWCHNPETIKPQKELALHFRRCVGCGRCVAVCPVNAHVINGSDDHVIDRTRCKTCGLCVEACLHNALEIYGLHIAATEAANKIFADRAFYAASGGGATVSGGEPLLYPDFCAELGAIMRRENIHFAIDTCGNAPWASFRKVLPVTDLFLYDFKHANTRRHRRLTGVGNRQILANLTRLAATGIPIEVRMPMVTSLNTDAEDVAAAAAILADLPKPPTVRLLAYHALARGKYAAIGRPDTMPDVPPPTRSQIEQAAAILRNAGLDVIA